MGFRGILANYGTVVMLATGVGIFAVIPYVQDLFDGYSDSRVRTRKLRIHWQVEHGECMEWAKKWMDEFLTRSRLMEDEEKASVGTGGHIRTPYTDIFLQFFQACVYILQGSNLDFMASTRLPAESDEVRGGSSPRESIQMELVRRRGEFELGRRLKVFQAPLDVQSVIIDEIQNGERHRYGKILLAGTSTLAISA